MEMTVVVLGHVDHGKSTLVGRLLYDTGQVQADRVDFACRRSAEQGRSLEFAFLLDGLAEEQEQGITIDFTQTRLRLNDRDFVIADAPGHREFLKNMLSGASRAEAAIVVIDASEGVREQSRRHGYLLSLLGVRQIAVVVNKMDIANWSETVFKSIRQEYAEFLHSQGMEAMQYIPVAAYTGDNLIKPSENLAWYQGPTVCEQFLAFQPVRETQEALRFIVQDVYRFGPQRLVAGRIETGHLTEGQEVVVWPTVEKTKVTRIECWPRLETRSASQGECVALELADPLFVERGMMLAEPAHPPISSRCFHARVVWLGRKELVSGQRYKLKLGCQETGAWFERFDRVIDIGNLQDTSLAGVPAGFVGEGILMTDQPILFDVFSAIPATGRFVLVDGYQIAGGGIVLASIAGERQDFARFTHDKQAAATTMPVLFAEPSRISRLERQERNRHHSFVVWLTGLSGAGKSTLARGVEKRLFDAGVQTYVLDGDNVRNGLNRDLSFSAGGRRENIRRVGEVAKLFVDAGFVVITAFISPYANDRDRVSELLEPGDFAEVFVKCSLAACEQRDVKGLYAKARQGIVRQFTGIDDVYEEPEKPELVIDTEQSSVEECVEQLYKYVIANCRLADK